MREFLTELRDRYPDRGVALMSALAEGADRLVADVALELGVGLTVLLPMPRELYVADFERPDSLEHFERLCARADDVFELPLVAGVERSEIVARRSAHGRCNTPRLASFSVHIATCCWRCGMASRLTRSAARARSSVFTTTT